jgi:hypothetical protein
MALGDRWRVDLHEAIWLVQRSPWGGDAAPAGGEALSASAALARLPAWFPEGWGGDERLLADICLSLEGAFPSSGVPEGGWLRRTVRRAIEDGRLVAFRMPLGGPVEGFAEEEEEAVTPRRPVREEKTWIEIALVDDADPPQPVPFARYRIELPNGSPREGILDANGRARLVGIDPGECLVSFPDFDRRDWTSG